MFPGPIALGRSVVVLPDGSAPGPWTQAERVTVDDRVLQSPKSVIGVLHGAWVGRRPVVIELACDERALRIPGRVDDPVYELDPSFEFPLERLQFLIWTNSYDARTRDLVWWHARKAAKRMSGVREGGSADVVCPDGSALFIDGGPADPPELPTGTPVAHRWGVEEGSLSAAGHGPPSAHLAPDQLAAVAHASGGARVIAPAGSGKTRVLTERLRHLVVDRRVHLKTVTAVAYNREAAVEMRTRCADVVGRDEIGTIRTLNSLGLWICNELGGQGRLGVMEEAGARDLVQEIFPVRHQANSDTVAPYLDALCAVRLTLESPEAVEALNGDVSGLAEGFDAYRAALAKRRLLDFDEQIYRAIEILVRDPDARIDARRRCRRILVDEFQDLTPAHLLLIRLLSAPAYDCFGVGDDDQVIYGYSGATPRFLIYFDRYFPGSGHHALEVNYRCPPGVATAARQLLSYNRERLDKTISSPPHRSEPVPFESSPLAGAGSLAVIRAPGEELTGRCVEVLQTWRTSGVLDSDIAVLARVNSALLPIQIACIDAGIPATSALRPTVLRRTGIRTALAYLRIGCDPGKITRDDLQDTIHRPARRIARNVVEMLTKRPYTSLADIRRLSSSLSGGDVAKLIVYADDLAIVAAACQMSTASALQTVRLDLGLGESVDVLDASRGEADRSTHADDLAAVESVAALHPDAATFEQWLKEMLARPQAEGPVVLLSTVHKIKGKEWPRVVVLGASRGLFPHRLGHDTEGERRIFHVALTRAKTQVVILANQDAPSPFVGELDGSAPRSRRPDASSVGTQRSSKQLNDGARGSGRSFPATDVRAARRPSTADRGRRRNRGASAQRGVPKSPAAVAAVGLEFEYGGHRATVVELRVGGAVVQVGAIRTELAYGSTVLIGDHLAALAAPADGSPNNPAANENSAPVEASLRVWRKAMAKAENVSAFVVLSDRHLVGIAERQPSTLAQLALCPGMGPIRLERYGDQILAAIEGALRDT